VASTLSPLINTCHYSDTRKDRKDETGCYEGVYLCVVEQGMCSAHKLALMQVDRSLKHSRGQNRLIPIRYDCDGSLRTRGYDRGGIAGCICSDGHHTSRTETPSLAVPSQCVEIFENARTRDCPVVRQILG
jgi:hypothetical protein